MDGCICCSDLCTIMLLIFSWIQIMVTFMIPFELVINQNSRNLLFTADSLHVILDWYDFTIGKGSSSWGNRPVFLASYRHSYSEKKSGCWGETSKYFKGIILAYFYVLFSQTWGPQYPKRWVDSLFLYDVVLYMWLILIPDWFFERGFPEAGYEP